MTLTDAVMQVCGATGGGVPPPLEFQPLAADSATWDGTVGNFSGLSLPQTWAYGEARAESGGFRVERGTLLRGGRVVGATQVLVRHLPLLRGGLAWIGRGPLLADPMDLADALMTLRHHFVEQRGMYLRIAPPTVMPVAIAGFRATGSPGWASSAIDLDQDLPLLRAAMHQKWRSGLNKAERSGAKVEMGMLDAFLAEYREFVAARGFSTSVTPELLLVLSRNLPEGRLLIYRARHQSVHLGSALIVRFGTSAEYLAGTLLPEGRTYNAGQLLLWRAITDMRQAGCNRFDLGGMDMALTPKGIFDFKVGLGGTAYRFASEIEAYNGSIGSRLVRWRVSRARAS